MADNVELNAGSGGATLAAASLTWGGDTAVVQVIGAGILSGSEGSWTFTEYVGGAGAVTGGVQRVTLASDDPAVALLGTIDTDTGAMVTDLAAIEVLITAGNVDLAAMEVLLTGIDADTDAIKTAVELLDNAISGAGFNITQLAGAAVPIGAGVEATALRVTLATDSTGVVSVDDNGGSLTVDGTVTANLSATDNAVLDAIAASVAGTLTVGSHAVTNAGTFAVQVDGNALTALQLIDDPVATIGSTPLQRVAIFDASDNQITSFGGSGGTAETDDAAFVAGTGSGTPVMGFFSTDTVASGDVGVLAMDASRRLLCSIEVDNVGIGGGTQYAVDAALGATPTGTVALGKRDDALSSLTPVEGDAVELRVDANGALWVIPSGTTTVNGTVTANLGATDNAVLDSIDTATTATQAAVEIMDDWDDGSDHCEVVGAAAEDAAVAGAPVLAGGRYDTTERTLDNGDAGGLAISAEGWMMVGNQSSYLFDGVARCQIKRSSGVAASGTTAIISAVAGKKFRVLAFTAFATSATVTNIYLATTTDTDVLGNSGNPIPVAVEAAGDNVAGFVLPYNQGGWTETSTANEALNLILSAAQDVIYAITYIEVS